MYFAMEQDILDAIFAATDNSWEWSFEHRNEIERQISAAQQAMAEEMFNMQVRINKEEFDFIFIQKIIFCIGARICSNAKRCRVCCRAYE